MFKKALKKLRGKSEEKKAVPAAKPQEKEERAVPKAQSHKILTAEGWKRMMMKKYRKP